MLKMSIGHQKVIFILHFFRAPSRTFYPPSVFFKIIFRHPTNKMQGQQHEHDDDDEKHGIVPVI